MAEALADGGLRVGLFGEAYIHNLGREMSMAGVEGVLIVAGHAMNAKTRTDTNRYAWGRTGLHGT